MKGMRTETCLRGKGGNQNWMGGLKKGQGPKAGREWGRKEQEGNTLGMLNSWGKSVSEKMNCLPEDKPAEYFRQY